MPGNKGSNQAATPQRPSCSVCYDLDREHIPCSNQNKTLATLTRELQDLIKASKRGCQTCYAIRTAIVRLGNVDCPKKDFEAEMSFVCIYLTQLVRVAGFAAYRNSEGRLKSLHIRFELFTKPDKPSPWPAFGPAREITQKLNSKRRQKMVRGWISDCTKSHKCYSITMRDGEAVTDPERSPAPRRLLDLGTNPRNGLKLADASLCSGPYVAVIHGYAGRLQSTFPPTTTQNLERRRKELPWWQIPLALQEALVVANEQGIRFAWISDFCVVQDDEEDTNWHLDREDFIFRLSHFTIALTGVKDLRLSNFSSRKVTSDDSDESTESITIQLSRHGRKYPIQARHSMHSTHWIFAERRLLDPILHNGYPTKPTAVYTGLFKHAPTFQRLMLSPKLLYLHKTEMTWSCLEGNRCECEDQYYLTSHESFSFPGPKAIFHSTKSLGDLADVFRLYMSLPLPEPDTRLVHMASLTRFISQASDKKYVAAISADTAEALAEELLWSLSPRRLDIEPDNEVHRHHTRHIPTWSWASMVLNERRYIQSIALLLPTFDLGSLVLNSAFHYWGTKYNPARGSCEDGLLASDYKLVVSGLVIQGRVTLPLGNDDDDVGYLNFVPINGLFLRPLSSARFQPDCERFVASFKNEERLAQFSFLLFGTAEVEDYDYPPKGADFADTCVEVGLVLRASQRDYGLNGHERVGTFTVPKDYNLFAKAEVQTLLLV